MNQNQWILVDKSVEIKVTDPKIGQNLWILKKTLEIGGIFPIPPNSEESSENQRVWGLWSLVLFFFILDEGWK